MSDRKTQARSLDTRRRLREATLDTIVEVGLPRASTPKINQRARVSNGAQQHHYPTRSELIVSSLEDLTNEYTDQLDHHLGAVAPRRAHHGPALDRINRHRTRALPALLDRGHGRRPNVAWTR